MPLDQKLVKDYLANRNKLKKHFLQERVQKQEMTRGFEKQFAPLLEPTRETAKETKEVKKVLTELPEKITEALPKKAELFEEEKLQIFNEKGVEMIKTRAVDFATKVPPNYRAFLLQKSRSKPSIETWRKWIYREVTGEKQARGPEWERFKASFKQVGSGGIKYYNDPDELLDRLETLVASHKVGNTSRELKNEVRNILDRLLEDDVIDEKSYKGLWDVFN